jgi:hypothetical protein
MRRLALGLVSAAIAAAIPVAGMAADVNVQVSVPAPPPPAVAVEAPAPEAAPPPLEVQNPEMVVVPSGNSYVYMVPNVYGVYFTNGFWYRYYNGIWFRSNVYNGGWVMVRPALVPRVVIGVYPEYAMYLPAGYFRIGWGDFHSHWRSWGPRHWQGQRWFSNERRFHNDRIRHIQRERANWHSGHAKGPHGYKAVGSKGSIHKTGPKNIHKTGPNVHKSGPNVHKSGTKTIHKTGPSGVNKTAPMHKEHK